MNKKTITRTKVKYYEVEIPNKIEDFKRWEFTSGCTTGEDFNTFSRLFKNYLKKQLPNELQITDYSKGHYYVSGFISDGKSFVYFSISDVRHFPAEWHTNILIRTAKHNKDYTGGSNMFTNLESFANNVKKIIDNPDQ